MYTDVAFVTSISIKINMESDGIKDNVDDSTMVARVLELHDEAWWEVASFLQTKTGGVCRRETMRELFSTVSLLSKRHRACMIRYVQLVPQYYEYHFLRFLKYSWAMKVRMSLGKIYFWSITSRIELNLCLRIIRECCIANLNSFEVSLSSNTFLQRSIMQDITRARSMFPDVPREMLGDPYLH